MEQTKFELGPIQKEWMKSLREHPERQTKGHLGFKTTNTEYKACCLGEGLCVLARMKNQPIPFNILGKIFDEPSTETLYKSYHELGLYSPQGEINGRMGIHKALSEANDGGMTWPEIADFIEANPEKVFTRPV